MSIKLIVTDVDGTLTDGMYLVSDAGTVSKSFYTRDFNAIQKALTEGFKFLILTSAADGAIQEKVKGLYYYRELLNNLFLITGCHGEKKKFLGKFLEEQGIKWDEVAYIGDAENDLACMESCKITGCPNDALCNVQDECNFIALFDGGHGAVHDFIEYVMNRE